MKDLLEVFHTLDQPSIAYTTTHSRPRFRIFGCLPYIVFVPVFASRINRLFFPWRAFPGALADRRLADERRWFCVLFFLLRPFDTSVRFVSFCLYFWNLALVQCLRLLHAASFLSIFSVPSLRTVWICLPLVAAPSTFPFAKDLLYGVLICVSFACNSDENVPRFRCLRCACCSESRCLQCLCLMPSRLERPSRTPAHLVSISSFSWIASSRPV